MSIITISREFGSGGRELGRKLAEILGFEYYDKEIVNTIAKSKGLDAAYVEQALEDREWISMPVTFSSSLTADLGVRVDRIELLRDQRFVIEGIGKSGKDCVIVGRNADIILKEYHPFKIFVCADMEHKIQRCMDRAPEGEDFSRKEIEQGIKRVDKARARSRKIVSGSSKLERTDYDLIVNTSDWAIDDVAPAIAEMAKRWFARKKP